MADDTTDRDAAGTVAFAYVGVLKASAAPAGGTPASATPNPSPNTASA